MLFRFHKKHTFIRMITDLKIYLLLLFYFSHLN